MIHSIGWTHLEKRTANKRTPPSSHHSLSVNRCRKPLYSLFPSFFFPFYLSFFLSFFLSLSFPRAYTSRALLYRLFSLIVRAILLLFFFFLFFFHIPSFSPPVSLFSSPRNASPGISTKILIAFSDSSSGMDVSASGIKKTELVQLSWTKARAVATEKWSGQAIADATTTISLSDATGLRPIGKVINDRGSVCTIRG